MKIEKLKKGVIFTLLITASVLLGRLFGYDSFAQNTITPPSFPACSEKIFVSNGDWAHYDTGVHGVPGVGSFDGSDDVYSLSSGNFLQCFCYAKPDKGIQTVWWNIERAGLSNEDINSFVSQGWVLENGSGWNLFN